MSNIRSRTIKIGEQVNESDGILKLSDESDLTDESIYFERLRIYSHGTGDDFDPDFISGVLPADNADNLPDLQSALVADGLTTSTVGKESDQTWYDTVVDGSVDFRDAEFDTNTDSGRDMYIDLETEEFITGVSDDNGGEYDILAVLRVAP